MDLDPLKVDSNFFKESSAVVSSKSLSYVQIAKRLDKTVLTVDYEPRSSKRVTIGDIGKVLMTEMDIKSEEVLGISKGARMHNSDVRRKPCNRHPLSPKSCNRTPIWLKKFHYI